jgi:hypothetical protein
MSNTGRYKTKEMKCLSCNKWIESKDLENHVEEKGHLENVEKKVNFMMQRTIKNGRI